MSRPQGAARGQRLQRTAWRRGVILAPPATPA